MQRPVYSFVVQIVKTCCRSLHSCCLPGKSPSEEKDSGPESQLEKYEWQLKILDEVLAASGSEERDQLLKAHQHGDLCVLVHTITEMVKRFEMFSLLVYIHVPTLNLLVEWKSRSGSLLLSLVAVCREP